MISLNSVRPFCWFHTYYLITTRFRINNAKISRVIILLSNRTLSALKCPVYKGFQKIFIIRTLGWRDLSGCFLVHICVFYYSYSSHFAFLCTSSKFFRAKIEPSKPFITYANIIETANNNSAIMSKYTAILKNLYFRLTISEL